MKDTASFNLIKTRRAFPSEQPLGVLAEGGDAPYLPAFKWVLCKGENDMEITRWVTSANAGRLRPEMEETEEESCWVVSWLMGRIDSNRSPVGLRGRQSRGTRSRANADGRAAGRPLATCARPRVATLRPSAFPINLAIDRVITMTFKKAFMTCGVLSGQQSRSYIFTFFILINWFRCRVYRNTQAFCLHTVNWN